MDEDGLARREPPALDDRRPDGEEGLRDRRGLLDREAFGHRERVPLVDLGVFGVAGAGEKGADLVAELEPRRAGPERRHDARHLEAGDLNRRAGRRRILTATLHDVGTVNAGRADLDQYLARTGERDGALGSDQHLRASRRLDHDRRHHLGKRRHGRESSCLSGRS